MLSRLSISLAQLKARNNSDKLNLKDPNKTMALIQLLITHGKIFSLHITTINLKSWL